MQYIFSQQVIAVFCYIAQKKVGAFQFVHGNRQVSQIANSTGYLSPEAGKTKQELFLAAGDQKLCQLPVHSLYGVGQFAKAALILTFCFVGSGCFLLFQGIDFLLEPPEAAGKKKQQKHNQKQIKMTLSFHRLTLQIHVFQCG